MRLGLTTQLVKRSPHAHHAPVRAKGMKRGMVAMKIRSDALGMQRREMVDLQKAVKDELPVDVFLHKGFTLKHLLARFIAVELGIQCTQIGRNIY